MSACSLYFDPSSDDESEQLNRIREKLKRRRVDELNLDTSDDDESCNDEKTSCHNLHHYDKTGNNNKDDIDDDSVISFCITNMIGKINVLFRNLK